MLNAVTDDPDKLYDTVLVAASETAGSQGRHCQGGRGQHRHHCNEDQAGGYQTRNCIIVSAEFNHKTATERDKATVEIFARAELDSRQLVSRGSALPLAQHPRAARRAVPPAPDSRAHFAAPRR